MIYFFYIGYLCTLSFLIHFFIHFGIVNFGDVGFKSGVDGLSLMLGEFCLVAVYLVFT
ncbi:hypothetical protein KFK09_020454 [Dendrobium nobile]|uniref:Uncharacterized protein n=1 Tax=Dendrobium nobile TaxID=94219 RepID=A0A8T3AMM5_DENNO|nr:hypothetical protein KFK09_020454 [Dendrobium nobile]